ncbi:MAG: helix-turn-helix transcriptional regulator [Verrucomicrobiota bacterium]
MIRNEKEYQNTIQSIEALKKRHAEQVQALKKLDISDDDIRAVTEPELIFLEDLEDEARTYERLCQGNASELSKFWKLENAGKLLIALRIFHGLTPSQLAEKLDVHPSQVTRDEKNEYSGITIERFQKIVSTLDSGSIKISFQPNEEEAVPA